MLLPNDRHVFACQKFIASVTSIRMRASDERVFARRLSEGSPIVFGMTTLIGVVVGHIKPLTACRRVRDADVPPLCARMMSSSCALCRSLGPDTKSLAAHSLSTMSPW